MRLKLWYLNDLNKPLSCWDVSIQYKSLSIDLLISPGRYSWTDIFKWAFDHCRVATPCSYSLFTDVYTIILLGLCVNRLGSPYHMISKLYYCITMGTSGLYKVHTWIYDRHRTINISVTSISYMIIRSLISPGIYSSGK
jgi:hypothetical protein